MAWLGWDIPVTPVAVLGKGQPLAFCNVLRQRCFQELAQQSNEPKCDLQVPWGPHQLLAYGLCCPRAPGLLGEAAGHCLRALVAGQWESVISGLVHASKPCGWRRDRMYFEIKMCLILFPTPNLGARSLGLSVQYELLKKNHLSLSWCLLCG